MDIHFLTYSDLTKLCLLRAHTIITIIVLFFLHKVCKEVSGVLDCCVLLDGPHLMTFIIPDLPRNEEVSLTEHSPAVAEIRDMLSSHDPGDTAESVDVADWASVLQRLKAHTEEHLPRHCIPDIFVRINGGLPLTLHGESFILHEKKKEKKSEKNNTHSDWK